MKLIKISQLVAIAARVILYPGIVINSAVVRLTDVQTGGSIGKKTSLS